MDWGRQAPADLGCDRASLGSGVGSTGGKGLLSKKDKDGVLGSGCLGLSIPLLPSEVLCRLVFFFNCDQSWGRGTREGPWKGLLPGLGAVMGAPPSYGAGTEPQGKLLINCWLF